MKTPRKLSPTEAKWVADLEALLMRAPKTLQLATIGDKGLSVWCSKRYAELDADPKSGDFFCDGAPDSNGLKLTIILSAVTIHGVSG